MTGTELAKILASAKVTPRELARRLGVSFRYVEMWVSGNRKIPDNRVDGIRAALTLSPRIYLPRSERLEIAELLDTVADYRAPTPAAQKQAARYRDKLRASVGGLVREEAS